MYIQYYSLLYCNTQKIWNFWRLRLDNDQQFYTILDLYNNHIEIFIRPTKLHKIENYYLTSMNNNFFTSQMFYVQG